MSLDHLLARDALCGPLDDVLRARAGSVLAAFGFVSGEAGWTFEDGLTWVTVTDEGGPWRVTVVQPLPGHLVEPVLAVLDGLVRETGLVRVDLFTRGELSAREWAARLARLRVVPVATTRG